MSKQYTIGELIQLSAGYLEAKGCPSPRLDAEILLGHVLELDRLALYLNFDKPLNQDEVEQYRSLIGRRGARIPVAYLTGRREFYSLPLEVTPEVLIPRPETEFVVEKVLGLVDLGEPVQVLELGTGSGAIALALAWQDPNFEITATDISEEALGVARKNAGRLELENQIEFVQSDLYENVQKEYRVICSNPPYIPRAELENSQPELAKEPALALDGGGDGLSFYPRILSQAPSFLKRPGFVVLEIGWNQAAAVCAFAEGFGLTWLETVVDYGGNERVVVFQWR